MAAQIGYYDTLKSVAGKVFTYLASITLTGTDGKTITVTQDTSLDEAVSISSKAPKANPVFTGDVKGPAGSNVFAKVDATNAGIFTVGGNLSSDGFTLTDNQSITITFSSANYGLLISIFCLHTGNAALFFVGYHTATITTLSDVASEWVTTDVDSGKLAIFQAVDGVLTIKNYANANRKLVMNILGTIESTTAPAP